MTQQEELIRRLQEPAFRNGIREWSMGVLSHAEGLCCDDHHDDPLLDQYKDDWQSSLDCAMDVEERSKTGFDETVAALARPPVVTPEELLAAFSVYLDANDSRFWGDGFDELYAGFLDHVRLRLLVNRSSPPLELCQFDERGTEKTEEARRRPELPGDAAELPPEAEPPGQDPVLMTMMTIWSKNGLLLKGTGIQETIDLGAGTYLAPIMLGRLTGCMSEGALSAISDELIPAVRAILRSVAVLRAPEGWSFRFDASRLPVLRLSELLDYRAFIVASASLIYPAFGKKDKTMGPRFSNAIRLLVQADQQTSPAVAIALFVAAIEALLGKKGPDIGSSLAGSIAVLLEPEAARRNDASKFVKELYDMRSRTLHGEQIDAGASWRERARTLAAACLYGLWFRNDFKARLDEDVDNPDALLEELKGLIFVGKPPDGVPEVPAARRLWDPHFGRE